MPDGVDIPFSQGEWLLSRTKPGNPGQFTGRVRPAGNFHMLELEFPGGQTEWFALGQLLSVGTGTNTIRARLSSRVFGRLKDLKRVITFEKLKGTLHEVIYSMEAAQIDFYPYQFKPVLKLIDAPTERLILADEVGLGKTIESALIWLELKARRQAKRLLVVCTTSLTEKWKDELRSKFMIDAAVVDFAGLDEQIQLFRQRGPSHEFALISTYSGLRPPKEDISLLDKEPGEDRTGHPKTELLRVLRHTPWSDDPFDLIIFDEAHYMRNPGTTTFRLGRQLASSAGAVLCVSATPVNNSNLDLHTLLRLIDEDFFESSEMFNQLLEANKPTIQAINALSRVPIDQPLLKDAVEGMGKSAFISQSPLFERLKAAASRVEYFTSADVVKCQTLAENLNLLGNYINRTRRVQVSEHRPVRNPLALVIEYTNEEMQLYKAILHIVRMRCKQAQSQFHVFQLLSLQLRAASCLPVLAAESRELSTPSNLELLDEALGEDLAENWLDVMWDVDLGSDELRSLLAFDFEKFDSKYLALVKMLTTMVPDDKVIIFAYYRPTLLYLLRRLQSDGISVTLIHGGIPVEERLIQIDRFRTEDGPRILLSSEVGSEGIDLQFCRVLVNYDLPWNPMRVEQRIGRIDRIGQLAQLLTIVNFKIAGTIEERIYDRLHTKLLLFQSSLGDLEAVIGKEVRELTVDLLSDELTPEQENERIARVEAVIERKLEDLRRLEDSGDAFVALSDYLQRKIEESRGMGRYIQASELEEYVEDFFQREFPGCDVQHGFPCEYGITIQLTTAAFDSLGRYIANDVSLSARPFRQRKFSICFRRDEIQKQKFGSAAALHFANHLSPFVRWMTYINESRTQSFYNLSAVQCSVSDLEPGEYIYRIERWNIEGLTTREVLAYGAIRIADKKLLTGDLAESTMQSILHNSRDWLNPVLNYEQLTESMDALEVDLSNRFSEMLGDFEAMNANLCLIKEQRVRGFYERKISQHQQALDGLRMAQRSPGIIRATQGRLDSARRNMSDKLTRLEVGSQIDARMAEVAAGVFRVN